MTRTTLSERLYRLLLRCYPGEFRDDYEREMMLAFRERLSHDRGLGLGAVLRLWGQLIADSLFRAPWEHLDVLRQDVRYTFRSLRRTKVFALTAIATIALGVGANTAIFSVVHAVALRPLPYEAADRLVRIWERNDSLGVTTFAVSLPNYVTWRARARSLDVAGWRGGSVTLRGKGDPARVTSVTISPDYFRLLSVKPVAGRVLTPADENPAAGNPAVIRDSLWRRQFDADPGIVGSSVSVGGQPYTVVGIVPEDSVPLAAELYVPLRFDPAQEDRDNRISNVIARIRPGFTFEQAQAEMQTIARQIEAEFPASNKGWGITMSTVYDWLIPEATRNAMYVLLGTVGCLLLIACANVANLLLARGASRKRELAMRMAIGAARRRLVRQMLTEGFVLAILGGAAGVLLASWTLPMLRAWLPTALPRANETTLSVPVLLFSLGVCLVTGIAFAILPALASSRGDVVESLKEGGRGSSTSGGRSRQVLAAAQVALATVLLVGAGLLVQSLIRLQRVDLGFDPANVTTGMMGLQGRDVKPGTEWDAFYRQLLEKIAAAPGVESVGLSSGAPFGGGNTGMPLTAVGQSQLGGASLQTDWRMVSPSYFKTLRIPLLRGRSFSDAGGTADENRLIVSATMARRFWGDADPIGRQIQAGPNGIWTVVGVVGDVRNIDLSLTPTPTMYISATRYVWPTMTVVIRGDERAQAGAVLQQAVKEMDPQLAVYNVREMDALIEQSASQPRLNASLVAMFAGLAALLAALGIYGVLAYLVSQRTQEIGIRMALGAERSTVLHLVLSRGLWLAGAGLVLGIAGAVAVARWIESLLFEVRARDPWTIAAAVAMVAAIATLASYLPARRASRVDPLVALRPD
jgi:putative ABC transport system permease protein